MLATRLKSLVNTQNINQVRHLGLYARYENFLEKRLPRVYKVHRLVVDGCKGCVSDVKTYTIVSRDLNAGRRTFSDLSSAELNCFLQTREELPKLVTIVCVAPLPFTINFLALAIIFFPRLVLTRHFWTDTQKPQFWQTNFDRRFAPRLRRLSRDTTREKISSTKKLVDFDVPHLITLCRIHRTLALRGCRGLEARSHVLQQLDRLLAQEEGKIDSMEKIQLMDELHLRRLDFKGLDANQMRDTLRKWLKLSQEMKDSISFLHLPTLFISQKSGSKP